MREDVLDGDWDPSAWWTTTNFGEAVPGILSALNWSLWSEHGEKAIRKGFYEIGVISAAERAVSGRPDDRVLGVFHGRIAGKVDFLGWVGDRLPGTTGEQVASSLIGEVPAGFTSNPTTARYRAIIRRLPRLFASLPRRLRTLDARTATWWQLEVAHTPVDLADARDKLARSRRYFEWSLSHQILGIFAGVQPVHEQLLALADKAGNPELAGRLLAGQGSHAEMRVVEDLWKLSRDAITLDQFIAVNGFHGPAEGEVSSRVWREEQAPVRQLIEHYKRRTDDPDTVLRERAADRERATGELMQALGRGDRAAATVVLRLAETYIPTRGLGKASFLRSLDACRYSARHLGTFLADAGVVDAPDDVFNLLADELAAASPGTPLQDLVAERKAQRDAHAGLKFAAAWKGRPTVSIEEAAAHAPVGTVLQGLGVSPGVVEGDVRVVLDPDYEDVEDGEVLVAPFTDPSWASIMFCSSALIVEVGGALSHAAVVARELGIPCVMAVEQATNRMATGDRVRIDGQAGTIEIL